MRLFRRISISQDRVEFSYVKTEGKNGPDTYCPYIPVTFFHGKKQLRTLALVDTGAALTILPMAIAYELDVRLDDTKKILLSAADSGDFTAFPSQRPIEYAIEKKGHRPIKFEGTVYFADNAGGILLGHHQCLEKFDVTFLGPEKKVSLFPRFKI